MKSTLVKSVTNRQAYWISLTLNMCRLNSIFTSLTKKENHVCFFIVFIHDKIV
jgi:ribosomal protein L30/L7E